MPLLQSGKDDRVPLQTLGPVQCRDGHPVARCVRLRSPASRKIRQHCFEPVGGRGPDDVEQSGQGRLPFARFRCGGLLRRVVAHPARQRRHELHHEVVPGQRRQQSFGFSHIAAFEECGSAHLVRDLRPGERGLKRRDVGIEPHQHCCLGPGDACLVPAGEPRDDVVEFGVFVGELLDQGSRTVGTGGGQPQRVGEQAVGQIEDLARGSMVHSQVETASGGEPPAEVPQVLAGGAREGVDGLVFVTDHPDIEAIPQPRTQKVELRRVGVLELVDAEPRVALPDLLREVRAIGQQVGEPKDHVVEVDQPVVVLALFVAAHDSHQQVGRERESATRLLGHRLDLT